MIPTWMMIVFLPVAVVGWGFLTFVIAVLCGRAIDYRDLQIPRAAENVSEEIDGLGWDDIQAVLAEDGR